MVGINLCCCQTAYRIGNNYPNHEKLWGVFSYDTVFTVFITILVFLLGVLINRLFVYLDRKAKKRKIRSYFKTYLDRIIDKVIPILISSYIEFYKTNNIDTGITLTPPELLTGDFKRLHDIGNWKIFSAIKEEKSLSSLFSNLDSEEGIIKKVGFYHEIVRIQSNELRLSLEENIKSYIKTLADYVERVRIEVPSYPGWNNFHSLVNASILKFYNEIAGQRNLKKLYREIIRPIQEEVVSSQVFRNDEIGFKIAELGKEISLNYNKLHHLTIEVNWQYRRFKNYLEGCQIKLRIDRDAIKW